MNILSTTEAVVEGGRAGHGRTSDGRLAVELSVPKAWGGEGGPGPNPEPLFAVGYAACFHSGLLSVAKCRKLEASDSTVTAPVGIGPTGRGGFGLAVALDRHAPNLSHVDAEFAERSLANVTKSLARGADTIGASAPSSEQPGSPRTHGKGSPRCGAGLRGTTLARAS